MNFIDEQHCSDAAYAELVPGPFDNFAYVTNAGSHCGQLHKSPTSRMR